MLNEFYRIAFRKKVYRSIDELQVDLDLWVHEYNEARPGGFDTRDLKEAKALLEELAA